MQAFINMIEPFVLSAITMLYVMLSAFVMHKAFYFMFLMINFVQCTESSVFLGSYIDSIL